MKTSPDKNKTGQCGQSSLVSTLSHYTVLTISFSNSSMSSSSSQTDRQTDRQRARPLVTRRAWLQQIESAARQPTRRTHSSNNSDSETQTQKWNIKKEVGERKKKWRTPKSKQGHLDI